MAVVTRLPMIIVSMTAFISFSVILLHFRPPINLLSSSPIATSATTVHNLVFGLASSTTSLPRRRLYIESWWNPSRLRGFLFLDSYSPAATPNLPPVRISADCSKLPYSFPKGKRSAVRVARLVKDLVELSEDIPGVRWLVIGDDDTIFFPENLVSTLGRRDWRKWWYVGGSSEAMEQNENFSFDMAFGGGGFALSWPLARVLARVLDSCLVRYSHLYGSDGRIFSCLAELGVGLTRDLGFHQVDLHGDIFGMLASHPMTPLLSLHHLDIVNPIFPKMERTQAIKQLFKAVEVDPARILQQTVCYNPLTFQTVSVSWGYAVQIFEGIRLLPEVLSLEKTFTPWRRGRGSFPSHYMFDTRDSPKDLCLRPRIFFFDGVNLVKNGSVSTYSVSEERRCVGNGTSMLNLKQVKVFSGFLSIEMSAQLESPRRQCCDILSSSSDELMNIKIRDCRDELIAFLPDRKLT